MRVIDSWTGATADALRQAFRMTIEDFAGKLGIHPRTVSYWRERPDVKQRPLGQGILDDTLEGAPDAVKARFVAMIDKGGNSALVTATENSTGGDITDFSAWITATNASNAVIEEIECAMTSTADSHTQAPARDVLADVMKLHDKVQDLLLGGRQRLRQTRDLLRLDGELLAHASVLLSDLGDDSAAHNYGRTALLCLQEAEASEATAWYALAKTARWQKQYDAAAGFAQQGFENGPITPMSVQLASYEANAAALLGDHSRARQALVRAESFASVLSADGSGTSPWAFPVERQAIFRLSVLLRTGDAAGALETATEADRRWSTGEPRITATWAQIQTGAAVAHLLQGSLDGAVDRVTPVLRLDPQFRIATVTGWLRDLDAQLARLRFASSAAAVSLREQIREFNEDSLLSLTAQENG